MLWGQNLKVYTDHKSHVQDALGLAWDCFYRWCLILEECNPEIVYIKGTYNIVADAVRCLEYDMKNNTHTINVQYRSKVLAQLFNS